MSENNPRTAEATQAHTARGAAPASGVVEVATPPEVLRTTGTIAQKLSVPRHRVEYVVRTRGIAHCAVAGRTRVYDEQAVSQIHLEIICMRARRFRRFRWS